jgi:hypothetical protein
MIKEGKMRLSRRDFVKLSALGLGSAFLAACGVKPLPARSVPPAAATVLPKPTPLPATLAPATTAAPTSMSMTGILGRPTDRAVTINVLPTQATEVYVEYGTAPGAYAAQTRPVPVPAGLPANLLVDKLQGNTHYYYRLRSRAGGAGDFSAEAEHGFVTQRLPGESFTFTIDADPHNQDPNFNAELYAITLANALKDQPDFHVNLGDTFMTEKLGVNSLDGVVASYTNMRPRLAGIAADAPLFLVNGNHEGELGWLRNGSGQNLAVWCTQTRQAYFPNPIPNDFYSGSTTPEPVIGIRDSYYAWTWGDALFVALDPFWYTLQKPAKQSNGGWGYTLGKAQYDWLKQTLEASTAKYKFVFIHNLVGGRDKDARGGIEAAPYYEWGGKNADGSDGFAAQRPGWGTPIHQLLVQNHVSALFHGHDHVFVHQELDGIIYQEFPQPSLTKYDNTGLAQQYGYTHGDVVSSSGHLRVTVNPDQAKVEYVRAYRPQDETSGRKNVQVDYTYTMSA